MALPRSASREFSVLVSSPAELGHPGLAAAGARAGGVGLLDVEAALSLDSALTQRNLLRLLELTAPRGLIGLRLSVGQLLAAAPLLELIKDRPHWLVLTGKPSGPVKIPRAAHRRVLWEATSPEALPLKADRAEAIEGVIARGSECGGFIGPEAAFVLTQRFLQDASWPVFVQGGLGPHTAAACRAAGAAGVVLDDQLWLMPESPLPPQWRRHLMNLSGQEAAAVGRELEASGGRAVRVLARPPLRAAQKLMALAARLAASEEKPSVLLGRWNQALESSVGWGPPEEKAWPMGQSVGLAARLREEYATTGRLVRAILEQSRSHLRLAAELKPLAPGSPLAEDLGTRYPLVQGPMARVSDTPEFLRRVARAGALPVVALSTLNGPQAKELLQRTAAALGEEPWGAGVLGFVEPEQHQAQAAEIISRRPACGIISGGRPDQAAAFERAGVPAYLHAPTPELVRMFLAQGARRFILEGREGGGHVGPLTSFVLWESAIAAILNHCPRGEEAKIHLLFAGGVHDARSAAMVAAAAAPLAARGARIGLLMGTAYLFTQEAVASGAILETFQEQALGCRTTVTLQTGPGHANRVAPSPFAAEFTAARRRLAREGAGRPDAAALEALCLGRLRLAAKGQVRGEDGRLRNVKPPKQVQEGMYLMGQLAALRDEVTTMAQLHRDVSERGSELAARRVRQIKKPARPIGGRKPSGAAIIGLATLLPGAKDPQQLWRNLINKVEVISEVPPERWDWRLFYDADKKSSDKTYSKWGGFFEEVVFDPLTYGIPPKSMPSIGVSQLLALEMVRRALQDAGYAQGGFDKENTAVIFAAADTGGFLGNHYLFRALLPLFVEPPFDSVLERLAEWTEESFPGTLTNIVSGRVANRFDLGGPNLTVDAACAAALYALDLAVQELVSGRSNLVIVGGLDVARPPFPSKLSPGPRPSRPPAGPGSLTRPPTGSSSARAWR